ncbi:MAG: phosphatase PAP2 family protein [bacterium]|nr:phosphatase PAP2 family protein [bacterium]
MNDDALLAPLAPRTIAIFGVLCGIIAALIFTLWPQIDLFTSALFYKGNGRFLLIGNPLGTIPRSIFKILFITFCAMALIGLLVTALRRSRLFGLGVPHWAYLVACLVLGPGLLTNAILKDHWGRARPIQTEQFGAGGKFTPALVPSQACNRNCSFVSGESSSIFMAFFALALLLSNYRKLLLVAGVLIGSLSGLVRIGMGGHFLSDVAFSGIFMLLTASALYWLVFTKLAPKT